MSLTALGLLAAAQGGASELDLCEKALRARSAAGTAQIELRVGVRSRVLTSRIELATKGSAIRYRVRLPGVRGRPPYDRIVFIDGAQATTFDGVTQRYVVRAVDRSGPTASRLSAAGTVEDCAMVLLAPARLSSLLSGSKIGREGGDLSFRSLKAGTHTVARFDARTRLIKSLRTEQGASFTEWRYHFSPGPRRLALSLPKGARRVAALDAEEHLPKFADQRVRQIWLAAIGAYAGLQSVCFDAASGGIRSGIWMEGKRAREETAGLKWAYDGRTLRIWHGNRNRTQAVDRRKIPDVVASEGFRVHPFLRHWAYRQNPVRELTPGEASVRLVGHGSVGGEMCDFVEATSVPVRLTIIIRRRDHLMVKISSTNLSESAKPVASAEVSYSYRSIGRPLDARLFRGG
ncbi:MAG: hypothetical protein HY248_05710 [Fimbriimonas ginsengisoli]|uniref:Uncharacterized protein n=1 Tax=Fimbriimonas ginsengisoli TaxID=1005039 RepID=A0A931LXF7_FIMGI|nr:hypothetical protein [Fimbriimonas ginsengisoli]MBI3722031.1 hypothetical protein [Fimbriimonas ginsengisoli]